MSIFNDENELKHPAFHDEQIEGKHSRVCDVLFGVIVVFGLVAWVTFCIWLFYYRTKG